MKNEKIISELVLLALDGRLDEQQIRQLNDLIIHYPWASKYYLECMATQVGLQNIECLSQDEFPDSFDSQLWRLLAQNEKAAPAIDIKELQETEICPVKILKVKKQPHVISKFSLYSALLSATAIFLIALLVWFDNREKPVVAKLGKIVNVTWAGRSQEYDTGSELYAGPMFLKDGFAEILFDKGAMVVVEGPSEFRLESNSRIFLSSGKLYSVVPPQAVGFTVQTTSADIVDYGTEFGVSVKEDGHVNTLVFNGKVKISSGEQDENKEVLWLTWGQGASVDRKGNLSRNDSRENKRTFVQSIETVENWQHYLDVNLIQNPGFEQGTAGNYTPEYSDFQDVSNVAIEGWHDDSPATIFTYNSSLDSFPRSGHDPVPDNCGRNFFIGICDNEIYQDINVRALGYLIDGPGVSFQLSGWLGGYRTHNDTLLITASFRDKKGQEISRTTLEPVTSKERKEQTMFILKKTSGAVPTGTDTIRITLETHRSYGTADSYADNLKLVLTKQ